MVANLLKVQPLPYEGKKLSIHVWYGKYNTTSNLTLTQKTKFSMIECLVWKARSEHIRYTFMQNSTKK